MPTPELAVVHPLVLLSVVDHYNRVAKDTKKRVVGVLLGENSKGRVEITNSFAGATSSCTPHSHTKHLSVMAREPVATCDDAVALAAQCRMKRTIGIRRFGS